MNWKMCLEYWSLGVSAVLILILLVGLGIMFPVVGFVELILFVGGLVGITLYNNIYY